MAAPTSMAQWRHWARKIQAADKALRKAESAILDAMDADGSKAGGDLYNACMDVRQARKGIAGQVQAAKEVAA